MTALLKEEMRTPSIPVGGINLGGIELFNLEEPETELKVEVELELDQIEEL